MRPFQMNSPQKECVVGVQHEYSSLCPAAPPQLLAHPRNHVFRYYTARLRVVQIFARSKLKLHPTSHLWPLGRALIEMRAAKADFEQKPDKPDLTTKLDKCISIMEDVNVQLDKIKDTTENVRKNTNITKSKVNKFHKKNAEKYVSGGRWARRSPSFVSRRKKVGEAAP